MTAVPRPPELSPGVVFAGYRIEAIVGRGGMGVIYRATQVALGRPVALKLLRRESVGDAAARERFVSESRLAASIDHPNVIPVYAAGEQDGTAYIAMRYVPGEDLGALVRREGRLSAERAVRIIGQVASALDAAHERGLVHRDVKPGNVLLGPEEHVYLTDFGLTKPALTTDGLTRTGQWVGTPEYAAPEQIRGAPLDARTDVYALGCLLFFALTGRGPYAREGIAETLWAHAHESPPRLGAAAPDAPVSLEAVIDGALAKDPADRLATAGELAAAAAAAVRAGEDPSRQEPPSTIGAGLSTVPDRVRTLRHVLPWSARLLERARRVGRDRTRAVLLGGTVLLAAAVAVAGQLTGVLRPLELDTIDARRAVLGTASAPDDIVVVGIDDATFREVDRYPLPRSEHARVIDALRRAGARVIAYDVQFTERTSGAQDGALVAAVERARGHIVLATTEVAPGGRTRVLGGDDTLRAVGARAGAASLPVDVDGIIRRFPHRVDGLDSLPIAALEAATGADVGDRGFRADGTAWIDFPGPAGTVPTVSFADVRNGRVDRSRLRGRIAVVGATDPALQDLHATGARGGPMSGAEIMAGAIATLRSGVPLRELGGAVAVLLTLLAACAVPSVAVRRRVATALGIATALGLGWLLAAQAAFGAGLIVPVVAPVLAIALTVPGVLGSGYAGAAADRRRVRDLFARFVPERVVDEVIASTGGDLRLGARRAQATVLVCDLRDFTAFAERVPAEQVLEALNVYFEEMTDAVLSRGGTLLSYQGDGLLAAFGAPLDRTDHADCAIEAARDMVGPRLDRFNAWVARHALGGGFRLGIGVHSGILLAGNVGSRVHLAYTAVGETVSTAVRLEALTKTSPHRALVSDATRVMLLHDAPDLVYVDAIDVRGHGGKIGLWTFAEGAGDHRASQTDRL